MKKILKKLMRRLDEIEENAGRSRTMEILDKGLRFGLDVYQQFSGEIELKKENARLRNLESSLGWELNASRNRERAAESREKLVTDALSKKAEETRALAEAAKKVLEASMGGFKRPDGTFDPLPADIQALSGALKKVTLVGEDVTLPKSFTGQPTGIPGVVSLGSVDPDVVKQWLKGMGVSVDQSVPPVVAAVAPSLSGYMKKEG